MKERVFIGLGTNLGLREAYLDLAIEALRSTSSLDVVQTASIYETDPVGLEDQPAFLNTVIEVKSEEHPKRLLQILKQIERDLGRNSATGELVQRWGPREIDLDLLLYGDQIIQDAELQVPHREMHRRRFVLVPLAEIAPDVRHPVFGKNIAVMLQDLADEKGVELFLQKDPKSSRKIQAEPINRTEIIVDLPSSRKTQVVPISK